jgi:hypothetical protein
MDAAKTVSRFTKVLRGVKRALPLAMRLSLPTVAEAMDKADTDIKNFAYQVKLGVDGEWGSQMTMALSVGMCFSLSQGRHFKLEPVILRPYGLQYRKMLFNFDPEYDSD